MLKYTIEGIFNIRDVHKIGKDAVKGIRNSRDIQKIVEDGIEEMFNVRLRFTENGKE